MADALSALLALLVVVAPLVLAWILCGRSDEAPRRPHGTMRGP